MRIGIVLALCVALFAPATLAQSGRKTPEKARKDQPAKPGEPAPQVPAEPAPPPLTDKDLQDAVQLGVNVVDVETVVYNKKSGAIYTGLQPKNFELYEDGIKQEITNFIPSQGPMTVVVLIEFSKRIDNRAISKVEVLRPLYTLISGFTKPDDNVAIVAFDTRPVVITDFTGDTKLLRAGLDLLVRNNPAFSESNIYDALAFTLKGGKAEAVDFSGGGLQRGVDYAGLAAVESRTAVILVSIGFDTFSKLNYDEVRKVISSAGVPIYTIGVGNLFYKIYDGRMRPEESMSWQQAFNTLRTFSRMSGGKYYPITFPGELPSTIESITNLMRHQYSLGYSPSNTRREGKQRKIEVKVDVDGDGKADEKDIVIQHRESYIEPNDARK
jgi:VWFA-related protein